jgi:hypothetical protein
MHRLAVRDDHPLERKIQQSAQCGQRSLVMPGRGPHAQVSTWGRQCVGENNSALLGTPQRRFLAAAAVIQRNRSTGQLPAGIDGSRCM